MFKEFTNSKMRQKCFKVLPDIVSVTNVLHSQIRIGQFQIVDRIKLNQYGTFIILSFCEHYGKCWRIIKIEGTKDGFTQHSSFFSPLSHSFNDFLKVKDDVILTLSGRYNSYGGTSINFSVQSLSQDINISCVSVCYKSRFNEIHWVMNKEGSFGVITTGDDKYGFKKYQCEKASAYIMNIITYEKKKFNVHKCMYLDEILSNDKVDKLILNSQEDAVLLCTVGYKFLWYSFLGKCFGQVMQWEKGEIKSRLYFYHEKYGDTLVIVSRTNRFYCVYLNKFAFCNPVECSYFNFKESKTAGVVLPCIYELFSDKFGNVLLVRCASHSLDIYDFLCGKFKISIDLPRKVDIHEWEEKRCMVFMGDLGNELYFFETTNTIGYSLHIYYCFGYNFKLVDLAKKAVWSTYTKEDLQNLELPKKLQEFLLVTSKN